MTNNRFQIIQHSFSLALENEWQDLSCYRFRGPEYDGLNHYINIHIDIMESALSAVSYADVYLRSILGTLHNFTLLKQGDIIMFDKNPAYEIVYQWQVDLNKRLIQRCMFVRKQQKMHILSTSFTPNSWQKLHQTIDNMMRSFS